ncbi:hypothetical protein Ancab_007639, partial [Ancistrocladus abbreviatus]
RVLSSSSLAGFATTAKLFLKAAVVLNPQLVPWLCRGQEYDYALFIGCLKQKDWHHADAVELDESRILDLLGFECCRCRRIKSPVCPYIRSMACSFHSFPVNWCVSKRKSVKIVNLT